MPDGALIGSCAADASGGSFVDQLFNLGTVCTAEDVTFVPCRQYRGLETVQARRRCHGLSSSCPVGNPVPELAWSRVTGDAELDAAEELVGQAVERFEGSGYFASGVAAPFLAELAYKYRRHGTRAMLVSTVAGQPQWKWPPGMSEEDRPQAAVTLFEDSGIAARSHDELRFVSDSVCRYLAASHVVLRHQDGRGLLRSKVSKYVAARSEPRSKDDEEFARFLVHRWWPTARPAVTRHLEKFLEERNRDPNIFFVAGLCHRGMLAGSDLRDRTVDALRAEVGTAQRPESVWQQMVGWLHALEPPAAVAELAAAVQAPKPDMTVWRAFAAVTELTEFDPARGAASRIQLAENLWGEPEDQVGVAVRIGEADPELAARTLVHLARDPEIGEWRVEAALHVEAPPLWRELVEDDQLSDDGRWRLFDRLVDRDPPTALGVAWAFVATAHKERTRLRIADLVKEHDLTLTWDIATDVAGTTERTVDGWLRLDAIQLLCALDPSRAQNLLEDFSAWSVPPPEVRLRAAEIVADQYGRLTALAALTEGGDLPYRAEAARKLGERDRGMGATAFLAIAESHGRSDPGLLDLLHAAYNLDSQRVTGTLTAVAESKHYPDDVRVGAVEIATPVLTVKRRVELYVAIASTAADHATAFTVASMAGDLDTDAGRRVFAIVAERRMPVDWQFRAAQAAGSRAKRTLIRLGKRRNPPEVRLRAARLLPDIDQTESDKILVELVESTKIGMVRVSAALCLPPANAVPTLVWIVGAHGEDENVRCAAAEEAIRYNDEEARWRLIDLLPKLSPPVSTYVASLLRQ